MGSSPPFRDEEGFRFQASGFVCLVLVLTLAFACFACAGERAGDAAGQTNDTESAGVGTEATPADVRASDGAIDGAEQYRLSCRMQTYIFKEDMSKAEVEAFTSRITSRVQANLNGGDDKNLGDILDDIDVPTYKGLCG